MKRAAVVQAEQRQAPAAAASPRPSPAGSARLTLRHDIQGLRAVAVLLVIGNHAGVPGFSGGYVGVDVFFVISGFVITELLLGEVPKGPSVGLGDFYSRRVRRIAPAASATLVCTSLAAVALLGSRVNPLLAGDIRSASLFSANLRFISTGSNYFVTGVHPSLVTQFWSLGVEEQFYFVWPVVVFLVSRLVSLDRRRQALATVLLAGVVLSAWWSVRISGSDPVGAYYSPFTRFWELGLGCLLAVFVAGPPLRSAWHERLAAGSGATLLGVALVTLNQTSPFPGWRAWLPCTATALLIWAGAHDGRTPFTRLLSERGLVYIGGLSYSLYLMHYPWLEMTRQLAPSTGYGYLALALAGTALTAMCMHRFVEDPIRRARRLGADRTTAFLLLGVCAAASWATATIVTTFPRPG